MTEKNKFKVNTIDYSEDGYPENEMEILTGIHAGKKIWLGVHRNSIGVYGESSGYYAYVTQIMDEEEGTVIFLDATDHAIEDLGENSYEYERVYQ